LAGGLKVSITAIDSTTEGDVTLTRYNMESRENVLIEDLDFVVREGDELEWTLREESE
jgi:hypothetical protein